MSWKMHNVVSLFQEDQWVGRAIQIIWEGVMIVEIWTDLNLYSQCKLIFKEEKNLNLSFGFISCLPCLEQQMMHEP